MASSDTGAWDDAQTWKTIVATARGGSKPRSVQSGIQHRIYAPLLQAITEQSGLNIGQMGQSLDGRIAAADGQSHYINGPAGLLHLHRLRALVDAVVIGVGTAMADDPRLTTRAAAGPNPARVVIDPTGRLPATARCLHDDGTRRIVIQAVDRRLDAPEVETVRVPLASGGLAPSAIIDALHALGLKRLLIEGGAKTLSWFLAEGCLDRLHVLVGPLLLGSGRMGLALPAGELATALRPTVSAFPLPGGDVLFDCDLRSPQESGGEHRRA